MPPEGLKMLLSEDVLSFEEITEVVQTAAGYGINKIRITGGEPLVRKGLKTLFENISSISAITDLAMTTNGILLEKSATPLKEAGLQRINISLDTTDPDRFFYITRGGNIEDVYRGIEAAQKAGLEPIKLNCVVEDSAQEPDAQRVARFGQDKNLEVRFIQRMEAATGRFSVVQGGSGGDCPNCNRLRLSSDGMIRPCLFSDLGYSVRSLGAKTAIEEAIFNKPEAGGPCEHSWIRTMGG
jgi:cyclic pyranopterin phosphate synthase